MMVMTAKVDLKKILILIAAVAAVILSLCLLLGGKEGDAAASAPTATVNDARVKFLTDFGWDVTTSPKESSQVRIPEETSEVFDRYNALQKSQGYDLSSFAGKKVMRYVYEVKNYPGATEPVYATLLIYKDKVIGGDVTNTSAKGKIQGFKMPTQPAPTTQTAPTAPAAQPTVPAAQPSETVPATTAPGASAPAA